MNYVELINNAQHGQSFSITCTDNAAAKNIRFRLYNSLRKFKDLNNSVLFKVKDNTVLVYGSPNFTEVKGTMFKGFI